MAEKKQKQPGKPTGQRIRTGVFVALMVFFVLMAFALLNQAAKLDTKDISDVIRRANNGEIAKIEGSGSDLVVTLKGQDKPSEKTYFSGGIPALTRDKLIDPEKVTLSEEAPSDTGPLLMNIATIIVPLILIGALILFMFRQAQGQNNQAMGFGKSKARLYGNEKSKVTFS